MQPTHETPQTSFHTDDALPDNPELLVYGTVDTLKQLNDTFPDALSRYMSNRGVGTNKLSMLTGIANSTISRYCNGTGLLNADYLYAIFIALKLKPCQQRHLLVLAEQTMPDERGRKKRRALIIRLYLDGCSYDDTLSVASCNKLLKANHCKPLTKLFREQGVRF